MSFNNEEEVKSKIVLFNSESSDYYFNVIATIIKDNSSIISGMVVLFQNVTQLKQLRKNQRLILYIYNIS